MKSTTVGRLSDISETMSGSTAVWSSQICVGDDKHAYRPKTCTCHFMHNILFKGITVSSGPLNSSPHNSKGLFSALFNYAANCWDYKCSWWCDGKEWNMKHWWNYTDRGKPKHSEKICPSTTRSTTSPKWTGLGSNPASCMGGWWITDQAIAQPSRNVTEVSI